MCLLFETIRIIHNHLQNVSYHNTRVNNARRLLFQINQPWDLADIIKLPELDQDIIYRCRFTYSKDPGGIEFIPYVRRNIQKLYLIDCGEFEYPFKFSDRTGFEIFRKNIPDPEISDILLVKNGFITDTSFSNIALTDDAAWYTPSVPLLDGTKRQLYLDQNLLISRDIKPADLYQFSRIRLINAMLDLENGIEIPTENIFTL